MPAITDYDVIIMGAGLAGLTAGFLLKDHNILILEKEERPGGRVLTRSQHGAPYDLGAVFAYPAQLIPFPLESSILNEPRAPIGIFWDHKVHFGRFVSECLKRLGTSAEDMDLLRAFHRDPERDVTKLADHLQAILNGFFQVIHPGEIQEYLPERQLDAFIAHDARHPKAGNDELIQAYKARLKNRILCNARVLSVKEQDNKVAIRFFSQNVEKTLHSRTVLLTPPAPVVLGILDSMSKSTRAYLESLQYREGTVVALCIKGGNPVDFSYIVTPSLPMNTVLQQKTADPRIRILLVYYAGKKSISMSGHPHATIILKTLAALEPLKIVDHLSDHLLFSDVHHWPFVGPVISPACRKTWKDEVARPSQRVFLGGEHVCWDSHNPLPYGMAPAIISGKESALKIERFLLSKPFRNGFLVRNFRYLLSHKQPLFRGSFEECNIAYYGLILQAQYDEDLKHYLLDSQKDHLWEWQTGYGATAEDTALVLEGLMESNVAEEDLMPSLIQLRNRFFSPPLGAFQTVSQGRAEYWRGPSIDATAHIGYLMHRVAPQRFGEEIAQCVRFLLSNQHPQGYWQGKWFPSRLITTRYAVRLCAQFPESCEEALQKATQFVLTTQEKSGNWNDSVIDTANAMLILEGLGLWHAQREKAADWLRRREKEPGWAGEPVLYYWFDIPGGAKVFYHCIDKGAITRAWALLALKENV